jgi:CRP/FNR family transcriptional regulator, cyclic AMP receptor protein
MQTSPQKVAKLREHALFSGLGSQAIERLSACATIRKIKGGTTIFSKDDPGTGLFAVSAGIVKIRVPSPDGREAVLNLVYQGEIFGEMALLDGHPRSADAVAMTDCELIAVDRRDFLALVREDPRIALGMITLLCARLRWAGQQFEEVVFLNLPGRLAKLLVRLGEKSPRAVGPRKLVITQRELSLLTGTTRESVNKQLSAWAKLKWVRLERGGIVVLSPDAIAAIAAAGAERDAP